MSPPPEHPSASPKPSKQLACRQCRARKVKCDRDATGCGPCARLTLQCSYAFGDGSVVEPGTEAEHPAPHELTQAGIKRRRIQKACDACRMLKARCSGTQPCQRCEARGQQCLFHGHELGIGSSASPGAISHMASPAQARTTTSGVAFGDDPTFPHAGLAYVSTPSATTPSHLGDILSGFELGKKDAIRHCLDSYFENMDLTNCPTLHKASVLADWNHGQIDTNLLKVLCATGLGHVLPQQREAGSVCQRWVAEAQRAVLDKLGRISLAGLHTLVLLIKFHYSSHTTEDTWILISIAARLTLIKGLNHEQSTSITSPVQQECLRRLIWSIFYLDKIFSGGIDDLAVLPTSAVHVRLPCNDRRFQRGLSSSSPFLQEVLTDGLEDAASSDMDVLAYRMILFDIRHRVLAYTRRVKRQDSSLAEWEPELLALSRELERFGDTLPEELQDGEDRLMFMCHSKDGTAYITLYTMLYMCRCDLHRFVIPGIRESASSEALANTPPEYINRCQKTCLDNAIKLCDFWSSVYRLDPPRLADFTINVVSMYQCIKVIDRLAHLLPQDGEHDLENIKQKLQEALSLASHTRLMYPRIRTWFSEVERLIPLLGKRRRPSLTPPTSSEQRVPNHYLLRTCHEPIPRSRAATEIGEADPSTSARVVLGSADHPDSSTSVFDSSAWTRHWIAMGTEAISHGEAHLAEVSDFPPNIVSYDNLLPNRGLLAADFHDPGAALNVPFGLDLPASPFDLHLGAYGDAEFHPLFYGGCQTQEPQR